MDTEGLVGTWVVYAKGVIAVMYNQHLQQHTRRAELSTRFEVQELGILIPPLGVEWYAEGNSGLYAVLWLYEALLILGLMG